MGGGSGVVGRVDRRRPMPAGASPRDVFAIAIATPGPPVDGLDGRMVARLGSSRFGSRRGVPEIGPANVSALVQAREEC